MANEVENCGFSCPLTLIRSFVNATATFRRAAMRAGSGRCASGRSARSTVGTLRPNSRAQARSDRDCMRWRIAAFSTAVTCGAMRFDDFSGKSGSKKGLKGVFCEGRAQAQRAVSHFQKRSLASSRSGPGTNTLPDVSGLSCGHGKRVQIESRYNRYDESCETKIGAGEASGKPVLTRQTSLGGHTPRSTFPSFIYAWKTR